MSNFQTYIYDYLNEKLGRDNGTSEKWWSWKHGILYPNTKNIDIDLEKNLLNNNVVVGFNFDTTLCNQKDISRFLKSLNVSYKDDTDSRNKNNNLRLKVCFSNENNDVNRFIFKSIMRYSFINKNISIN